MVEIQAAGTKLVSVAENVDETPAGMLTHGVLAAVNEFRSRGDAEKVKLGLRRKHLAGGTPYEAPIGYRNERAIENGHEIRTVVIDDERAPLVRHAFDAYATGEWALTALADHLEDLGLQTRQRGSRPPAPLARSAVHHMLKNPYYIGLVPYRGVMRPGNHPPLVDRKLFDRVQQLLAAHALSGDRSSKHENYLKGSIFCGACGARLTYGRHRARSGQHYEYFSCVRKRTSGRVHCTSSYLPTSTVETAVARHWIAARLKPAERDRIRHRVTSQIQARADLAETEIARHAKRLATLEDQQLKLVHLYYTGSISEDLLQREQQRIDTERSHIEQLRQEVIVEVDEITDALDEALALTDQPDHGYATAANTERRLLNQAVWERLIIDQESVIEATKTELYRELDRWAHPAHEPTPALHQAPRTADEAQNDGNPDPLSGGQGSNVDLMVRPRGLEPPRTIQSTRPSTLRVYQFRHRRLGGQYIRGVWHGGDPRGPPARSDGGPGSG